MFDGGSHTVSNLAVHESDSGVVGLFACVRDARIYNLTVDGHTLTGAVVGYAYNSRLTAVSLMGVNAVVGHENANQGVESVGGVIGGATNSLIDSCSAKANVVLPDNSGKAGILCGGLESTSVINGYATGTLTAGDGCSEIGAVAGSVSDSEEITNCRSENIRITVVERAALGGMVGGSSASADDGAFVLTDCTLSGATVNGEKAAMVGGGA